MRLGRLDRLRDQVDRQAGDFAAVLAAQQRQPVRPGAGRTARRQVARKTLIVIGAEQAGINVVIAVVPERGADARSPQRIVVDVEIGERPEQRSDPAVSAIAVPPPAAASGPSVLPPGKRRARGHAGPHARDDAALRCGDSCGRVRASSAPGRPREIHALRGERTVCRERTACENERWPENERKCAALP